MPARDFEELDLKGRTPHKLQRPFEDDEYAERVTRVKQRMADLDVQVLVVADPANMNYLTGYDGWSFYVPQCVIVVADEDQPLWIGRGMDANGARVTTYLDDDRIFHYSDSYLHADDVHPMNYVAAVLKSRRLDEHRIGIERDNFYFSPKGEDVLRQDLPRAEFVDCHRLVNWVRAIKSRREIDYMREAGKIMERVMRVGIDMIEPGVRQCDAVAEILKAQIQGTDDFGGDYTSIMPMLPSGIGTSTPHLTWTDAPFVKGEGTILELAACRRRYHCPMARTVFLGEPPTRLVTAAKFVVEGIQAALDAVRPGRSTEEIEAAWRESFQKSGYVKRSRIGYSLGLNYPPDWGEHVMSLRPRSRDILQPDMTFHLIPGIWQDDWGIEISETFRVTIDGYELLTDFPRELVIKR